MDTKTILTIMTVVESIGRMSLEMYKTIQEIKTGDPDNVDLERETILTKQLEDLVKSRMLIRDQLLCQESLQ